MAYPQGINFRATSGYVTDGSGEDAELNASGTANYPRTTAQGNTVGWETTGSDYQTRNRNSSNDRRLAGIHFKNSGAHDYRMDLASTGDKLLRIAVGDQNYSRSNQQVEIFDTNSSLGTLFAAATTGAANSFLDAAGNVRTAAAWPGANSSVTKTFTTTICRVRIGDGSNISHVAHLYVEDAAAASLAPPPYRNQARRIAPLLGF